MPTILIVDDDPVTLSVLKRILDKHDHKIISAESAEQAIEIFDSNPGIDLVVTDIDMPGITGLEMVKKLSEQPRLATTPVVICSGLYDKYTLLRGLKTGAVDFIAKPIDVNILVGKIESALNQARASVLVMMDEPEECNVLSHIISRGGFDINQASSAEDGMQILSTNKINIVVIDIGLPGISGKDLADKIKRQYPDIPILLLTGLGTEFCEKMAANFGASGCISKPFNNNLIIAELHNQLKSIPSDSFS